MSGEDEFEQLLAMADRAIEGDWGEPIVRSPAKRFAEHLRMQGFVPSQEFVTRFTQRLQDSCLRFAPHTFHNEFFRARHYRQIGSRFKPRIAMIKGIPVLYRPDGSGEKRIMLL